MLSLVVAVLLAQDIQVSAEVDRDRLGVGDALTYLVRAAVDSRVPVVVRLPAFDGFTVIGRAERREEGTAGASDVFILELRLRAQRVGLWRVGQVRLEQGTRLAVSPEVEVAVEAGGRSTGPVIGPRVLQMLQRATPPPAGQVAVTLLVSSDTVVVGEQVDVVTAAWFPRELLGRLRRQPSLRPPSIEGVFSAIEPTAAGVAASRMVGGVWYDLHVAHQVVFPVQEGRVTIPAAGLSFAVPIGRQYFSEERPYNLTSPSRTVVVTPVSAGGPGPVARNLTLGYELSPEAARVGEPIPVDLVLAGSGNLALWPAPVVRWPEGSRGYADQVTDRVAVRSGLVAGTKRFRYIVIPDSSGTLALPDVPYAYYDPGRRAWREALAQAVVLPVQPRAPIAQRRSPPGLLAAEPWSLGTLSTPVLAALLLLLVGAPLGFLGGRLLARSRSRRAVGTQPAGALVEFQTMIRTLVPDPGERREERLAGRLRELGLEREDAATAAQLYQEVITGRFDPGKSWTPARLDGEVRRLLARWPGRPVSATGLLALLLLAAGASHAAAQAPGDSLYRSGAYAAAAEEWMRAAETAGHSARLWYNAGAAAWAAGQDARAAAAWIEARRLAPRDRSVRTAWGELAVRSADLQDAGRVLPLTPAELVIVAVVGWTLGWVLLFSRRRSAALAVFAVTLIAAVTAAAAMRRYARPIAIVSRAVSLREAPHGLAGETGRAEDLSVVVVEDSRPEWRLVRARTGVAGWVPAPVLVEVRGVDFAP